MYRVGKSFMSSEYFYAPKMVANGTAVYICDEKHLPSAVLLPFFQHSRTGSVIEGQCSLSIPTVKMLGNKLLSQN